MDQRDRSTWVVLELTKLGETKMEEGTLEKSLRKDLGVGPDFPIFIPMISYRQGSRLTKFYLMEGYAFVGSGLSDITYFALERKGYVQTVISSGKIRTVSSITNDDVEKMKRRLRSVLTSSTIVEGARVRVVDGNRRNLEGEVVIVTDDKITIKVVLRSLRMITTVPSISVEILERPEGDDDHE